MPVRFRSAVYRPTPVTFSCPSGRMNFVRGSSSVVTVSAPLSVFLEHPIQSNRAQDSLRCYLYRVRAMILDAVRTGLREATVADPAPGAGQVLVRVHACGVCRTDLHVVDGELPNPKLPLVVGHQIVGTVFDAGERAERFALGSRVGIPWLGWADGDCRYCTSGRENLCDRGRFTGYTLDGGYAELAVADERFCAAIPENYPDLQAAPLLCAGLIGYRALPMTGDAEPLRPVALRAPPATVRTRRRD